VAQVVLQVLRPVAEVPEAPVVRAGWVLPVRALRLALPEVAVLLPEVQAV
jgi:hypothetical protein